MNISAEELIKSSNDENVLMVTARAGILVPFLGSAWTLYGAL